MNGAEMPAGYLAAVEARIKDCQSYNFGMRNADKLAHEDAPKLLALVREQGELLERIWTAAQAVAPEAVA